MNTCVQCSTRWYSQKACSMRTHNVHKMLSACSMRKRDATSVGVVHVRAMQHALRPKESAACAEVDRNGAECERLDQPAAQMWYSTTPNPVQLTTYNTQCNKQHNTQCAKLQHATYHTTYNMQVMRRTNMQHATYHTTCDTQHAAMQHTTCSMHAT